MSEKSTPPPAESLSAEKQQADTYLKELAESCKKAEEHRRNMFERFNRIVTVSDNYQRKYDEIEELHKKLLDNDGKINNFLENIRQKDTQALMHLESTETSLKFSKEEYQKIVYCRNLLLIDVSAEPAMGNQPEVFKRVSIQTQVHELLESIRNEDEKAQGLLKKIEATDSDIANYHQELLIDEQEPEGEGLPRKSIQTKISDFFESVQKQKEEHEVKTKELHQQIEGLLPGAAAYGLSSSYEEDKKEVNERRFLWGGFITSLLLLVLFYFGSSLLGLGTDIEISTILTRIAIGSPFIWAAWYCQRTLSERQKIKEEYKHKQKMMKLYDGFMKQIQALGEDDKALQKKMVDIMLDAIKKNPAEFIGTPDTIMESKAKAIANKIPFLSSSNKKETK